MGLRDSDHARWRDLAPSASPDGLLSSVLEAYAVLLPERFRGGYAFGAGTVPGLSRESQTKVGDAADEVNRCFSCPAEGRSLQFSRGRFR